MIAHFSFARRIPITVSEKRTRFRWGEFNADACACGLLAGLVLSIAVPTFAQSSAPSDPRIEQLMRMVEAQQRRIEELERRLDQRDPAAPVATVTAAAPRVTAGLPAAGTMPAAAAPDGAVAATETSRPREFSLALRPLHMTVLSDSFRYLGGDANADPQTAEVDHGFRAGIEGELLFAPADRNFAVSLGGRHITGRDSASTQLTDIALFDAGFGGPAAVGGQTVAARSEVRSWQVDLDLRTRPREEGFGLFAGLRLAELNRELDITNNVDAISLNQVTFRGLGPRVGADGRLALGGGFYLDGALGGSLLFGRSEVGSQTNNNGLTPDLFYEAHGQRAVPVLDGRIALGWDLIAEARYLQALGIELGLRAQHWFGLQDFVTATDTIVGAAFIGDTDMTFAGPYMSVKARW